MMTFVFQKKIAKTKPPQNYQEVANIKQKNIKLADALPNGILAKLQYAQLGPLL